MTNPIAPGEEPFQGELFAATLQSWPVKDDIASMEIPVFSLTKKPDTSVREYRNGETYVKIIPPVIGAATVFDKDLLIYASSQIIEARNRGEKISPIVEIDSADFLRKTARSDSRESYERIADMLNRLYGTSIITTRTTGDVQQTEPFRLISDFRITSKVSRTETRPYGKSSRTQQHEIVRVLSFQVRLSDWLYNGLLKYEVLTLDHAYFRLSSSIERRLYEVARKYCGNQPLWKINIDLLAEKLGIKRDRRFFRQELRRIIDEDQMPEYHIALDAKVKPDMVVMYTKNSAEFAKFFLKKQELQAWFATLERPGLKRPSSAKVPNAETRELTQ
jgi:plasmid replication initiation protein